MNICVKVFMWTYVFIFLGYIPKSEIAGLYGNTMFNFLKNCQAVFQSSHPILHSHQQCINIPIFPHPLQHLLLSVFFIITITGGVKSHLIVVSICISLMTNVVEHLFMYLLTICTSSLEKCLFRSFVHF